MMIISGKTRIYGIIGDPINHSLSPIMHNAAFKELGLNLVYLAFKVSSGELKEAILGTRSMGLLGLNVTMPYKSAVMKYLDEIDLVAERIGSVNTIVKSQGKLIGYNTDGKGAMMALKENDVNPKDKKLLLVGAGGAAKAIAFQAAFDVAELVILNRTAKKARELANLVRKNHNNQVKSGNLSPKILKKELENTDILVNATSMGMHPNVNSSPVSSSFLKPELVVMDIIYNPLNTQLLLDAKKVGAKVISGIEMLIHQGAIAFEIWTKHSAPIEVMRRAILNELKKWGAKN